MLCTYQGGQGVIHLSMGAGCYTRVQSMGGHTLMMGLSEGSGGMQGEQQDLTRFAIQAKGPDGKWTHWLWMFTYL